MRSHLKSEPSIDRFLFFFFCSFFLFSFLECGTRDKSRIDSDITLPKKVDPGFGSLEVTLKDVADDQTVQGYIVSNAKLTLVQDSIDKNKFLIEKIPVGKSDVLITAQINGKKVGIRINHLKILKDKSTPCKDVQLKALGTITGNVNLEKTTSFSGVKVEILGTTYSAVTNQSGSYIISDVPEGIHSLNLIKKDYFRGSIEDVEVLSDEIVTASSVFLGLTNGRSGFIRINSNASKTDSVTVIVEVGASINAVIMKLSESKNFEEAEWQPLTSSLSYTFLDVGFHTLYVKFADADGQQSSVFQNSITVDVQKWIKTTFDNTSIPPWGSGAGFAPGELLVWGGGQSASSIPTNKGVLIKFANGVPKSSLVSDVQPPSERMNPSIVSFSDHRFVVWGGSASSLDMTGLNDGSIYSSALNTWEEMEYFNAPTPRSFYKTVKFENNFMIWGGQIGFNLINTGAIYHLDTHRWTDTTLYNAPEGRKDFLMLSMDTFGIFVWGGAAINQTTSTSTGAIYRPSVDLWTATPEQGAPTARAFVGGVWTGSQVLMWGGYDSETNRALSDGVIYEPTTNQWLPMNTLNAPTARYKYSAVWTGKYMVVWGGLDVTGVPLNNGGYYDPDLDTWQTIVPEKSLVGRFEPMGFWDHGTIWYWGGLITSDIFYAGLTAYKPNQIIK